MLELELARQLSNQNVRGQCQVRERFSGDGGSRSLCTYTERTAKPGFNFNSLIGLVVGGNDGITKQAVRYWTH